MWFFLLFITTFTEGLLQKASMLIRPRLIGSTPAMSHAAVNSDARSNVVVTAIINYNIQISSQNIRIPAKQAAVVQ